MSILGAIAAPVIGAVLGGATSGGGSQTTSKTPWAPAVPWLTQNVNTGSNLQNYYQQNPFNQQQTQGYQNLYSALDNYQNSVAPSVMALANQLMNTSLPTYSQNTQGFQQPQAQMPSAVQQAYPQASRSQQPQQMSRGLLSMMPAAQQPTQQAGGSTAAAQSSIPRMSVGSYMPYGLLNLGSQNPFTNGGIPAQAAAQAPTSQNSNANQLPIWDSGTPGG